MYHLNRLLYSSYFLIVYVLKTFRSLLYLKSKKRIMIRLTVSIKFSQTILTLTKKGLHRDDTIKINSQ